MRLSLKMITLALIAAPTILLSECMGPPPDMAPAAVPSFQHESYRQELIHREEMIEQGRAVHIKKEKLVV